MDTRSPEGRAATLILTRRPDQAIVMETKNGPVWVYVLGMSDGKVKLGIDAPASVLVLRDELIVERGEQWVAHG